MKMVFDGFEKVIFVVLKLCLACVGDLVRFENWVFELEVYRFCSFKKFGNSPLDLLFYFG
jgi:hypothetical protein